MAVPATRPWLVAEPPNKPRRRRKMTDQERIEYRAMRFLRPCASCVKSKRKCYHTRAALDRGAPKRMENDNVRVEEVPVEGFTLAMRPRTPIQSIPYELIREIGYEFDRTADAPFQEPAEEPRRNSEELNEELRQETSCNNTTTLCFHKPQSAENLSVMLFAENVQWAGVADSWFGEAPTRLGHDSCYDLAIDALMMVCWYGRKLPGATLPKVYRAMGDSLKLLNMEMSKEGAVLNDHLLATVAALSPVDAITSGKAFLVSTHLDGIVSLLVSRAALIPLSSVARRILEYHFSDSYVMASVRGVVGPFEALDRSYCAYTDLSKPVGERSIRTIGNTLCVSLPRLISLVRLACADPSGDVVLSAINLAETLLRLKDEVAEGDFLSAVGLVKTLQSGERLVTEYSINFKSLSSIEAGLYYWHTRTTLLRLCSRLQQMFPRVCNMYALPKPKEIQEEMQRHASHIAMSVQYARTNTARKRRRLLGHALVVCWSTLLDYPDALSNGSTAEEVRSWLLETLNITLLGQPSSITAQDLDDAAELFRGGPLVGRYKVLYDPPPISKS